jgi:spermidine dehydrogenase
LILDNHDDFGGHARRNVFRWGGTRLIGFGGTYAIEEPEWSPSEAVDVMESIGIDLDRMLSWRDFDFERRFGLSSGVFFDERVYPGIESRWVNGFHTTPYEEFFSRSPLSSEAQRELIEFYTTRKDYLPDVDDAEEALSRMSWESFIRDKMELGDHAVRFANLYAPDLLGLGSDAVSAAHAYEIGPGFSGMGGEGFYEVDGVLRYAYQPTHRFPDGNHTIARLLLNQLLPEAMPGAGTMEAVFNARVDYAAFDKKENAARRRLRSLAVRVQHEGPLSQAEWITVHYVQPDGRVYRVRGRGAVMGGWGMVAKHIVPEIPDEQRAALDSYRYTSAVYINVMLKQWRAIADIGAVNMYLPGGYCTTLEISSPLKLGGYRPAYHPDNPILLTLFKYLYQPGLDVDEQVVNGRLDIVDKPFEDYEREVRRELQHLFGGPNFNAADDIVGITVNRWGHGYNFFKAPLSDDEDDEPYMRGRQKLGRISFAGADAGGSPWSQLALQQGYRAAHEQLGA